MLDISKLYSFQGKEPQILPHEIMLNNGRSRTDNTTFTDEEILEAGFTGPYEKPEFDENTQFLKWNNELLEWNVKEILRQPDFNSPEDLLSAVRERRNIILQNTDWTQLSDNQLTEHQKQSFVVYRQELRDFPETLQLDIEKYMDDSSLIEWPELDINS